MIYFVGMRHSVLAEVNAKAARTVYYRLSPSVVWIKLHCWHKHTAMLLASPQLNPCEASLFLNMHFVVLFKLPLSSNNR